MQEELVEHYRQKIAPILPYAKKAYGSRNQNTPAHVASREYTRLLIEFYYHNGNLSKLAKALGVTYQGLRRRIVMSDVSVNLIKPIKKQNKEDISKVADRVRYAKSVSGTYGYHKQLALEYQNGVSLYRLSKELGLSSAAPLYYGVQRSMQR